MLTETKLHEKKHTKEMRRRMVRRGIRQFRTDQKKFKRRVDWQNFQKNLEEQRAKQAAELKSKAVRVRVAKQAMDAKEKPSFFRRALNRVFGRG